MPSEAQARITINRLLEEAGWRFLPDAHGRKENIVCEHRVSGKAFAPNVDLGADFEKVPGGFVDYLLLNTDGRPVAVVEAKKESIDPLSAKEQARAYAGRLGVSHIFLSNGLVHYYWNLRQGNPVKVSRFLPLEQLGKAAEWKPDATRLAAENVDEHYIAVSQDAAWLSYSPAERATVMVNKKIRLLRDYQPDAIRALQNAAPGSHRFLFEMATGTGKTLLSAAIAKLYLRTENASRILFLVDRLELENQAWRNFKAYLANDGIRTVIYKQKRQDWAKADVVVTTIQSLAQQATDAVSGDAALRQAYEDEDWTAVEERVRRLLFEKPQDFWSLPKLQQLYQTDRLPSLREILARVFGLIPEIPTRGQLADEAFERFVATQQTNAVHSRELKVVFVAFLLDPASRFLLQEGKFADLRARDANLYGSLLTPVNPRG